jgi:hypothetical protein
MSESTYKRVTISKSNLAKAEKLAETKNVKLSDYLDKLINEAITRDYKQGKQPLYVWKS